MQPTMNYCPNCGHALGHGMRYCPGCGLSFQGAGPSGGGSGGTGAGRLSLLGCLSLGIAFVSFVAWSFAGMPRLGLLIVGTTFLGLLGVAFLIAAALMTIRRLGRRCA